MEQPKEIVNSDSPIKPPKKKLPKRTKFAVRWIFTLGIVGPIATTIGVFFWPYSGGTDEMIGLVQLFSIVISIFAGSIYILPAIFLIRRKRWSWIAAVIMLAFGTISLTGVVIWLAICALVSSYSTWWQDYPFYRFIPTVFLYIVPLWFVLRDRRKYREMTEKSAIDTPKPTMEIVQ